MSIGVFDSGIGGLTVFSSIIKHFPMADLYYLGDTARVPYGNKSKETICRYSFECAEFLIRNFNIECLVVACNSASSMALEYLNTRLTIPVLGVVIPGARKAAYHTKNKKIGIIGTTATVNSNAYFINIKNINETIEVYQNAAPLLVPLVEEGRVVHPITDMAITEYILPLSKKEIDTLVLGCTHYPVLKESIKKIFPNIFLVDSSEAIIDDLKKFNLNAQENGTKKIFVTDLTDSFEKLKNMLVGNIEIHKAKIIEFIKN